MPDVASPHPSSRILGALLVACAAVSAVLLALHPGGATATLADVLRTEAAHQLQSAIVHGGSIALLAAQLAALAVLATRLAGGTAAGVVGLTLSAVSFVFLAFALALDGLVIPDVASRYVAAPATALPGARATLVLLGSVIRVVMPLGLAAQGAAALAWGLALWRERRRGPAGAALALGALLLAALVATSNSLNGFVVMGGFLGQALWLFALGVSLARRPPGYAGSGVFAAAAPAGAVLRAS